MRLIILLDFIFKLESTEDRSKLGLYLSLDFIYYEDELQNLFVF